jgi:hypothetical protein
MEKFSSNYRDRLADDLKEIRNSNEEKPELAKAEAKGYLKAEQKTTEYVNEEDRKEKHRIYQEETEQREKEISFIKEHPLEILEKYSSYGNGAFELLRRCKDIGIPVSFGKTYGDEITADITLKSGIWKVDDYIQDLDINPTHYNIYNTYTAASMVMGSSRIAEGSTLEKNMPSERNGRDPEAEKFYFKYSEWTKDYPHASKDFSSPEAIVRKLVQYYLGSDALKRRRSFVEKFKKNSGEIEKIEEKKEKEKQELIKQNEEESERLKEENKKQAEKKVNDELARESERMERLKNENVDISKLEWGIDLGRISWNDAQAKIAELNKNLAEEEKLWRLPTRYELVAEFKKTGSTPAGFEDRYYWSNNTGPSFPESIFEVYMATGTVIEGNKNVKTESNSPCARLVRNRD